MTENTPTKISFVYSNPTDPSAFEAAYPGQLALARKLPGLIWLATLEHATGGVIIAFAEVLEDA